MKKSTILGGISLTLTLFVPCCNKQTKEAKDSNTIETILFTSGKTETTQEVESDISFTSDELPSSMEWIDSKLTLDSTRSIWSDQSLRWDWKCNGSLTFHRPINWVQPKEARRIHKFFHPVENCFVFWVYNEKPLPDSSLTLHFGDEQKDITHFKFNLNFSGWRTAWVSYDSDMKGSVKKTLSRIRIEAPSNIKEGTLWLGDISPHKFIDERHRHGDAQVPTVRNSHKLTEGHWDPIMYWYKLGKTNQSEFEITESHIAGLAQLKAKRPKQKTKTISDQLVQQLEKQFSAFNIKYTDQGISGDHIYMTHQSEGAPNKKTNKGHKLKVYTQFMLQLAKAWSNTPEAERSETNAIKVSSMFCDMVRHMLDQGFTAESALGTMHHFGYTARAWVPAIDLMQKPLLDNGLLEQARESLTWFYNSNQMYTPAPHGANMDYLNTLSASDFMIHNLGADDANKATRLLTFSKWLSEMIASESNGKSGGFKPDGSLYHHQMHYFGYGIPALTTIISKVVKPLDDTPFEISDEAYLVLKKSLLSAQRWGYPYGGWNACGRHPITTSGNSFKSALLTLARSKPGTTKVDTELASAYLSMFGGDSLALFGESVKPTRQDGLWAMNYNAAASYLHEGNTVQVKGYGDGIKSHETYKADNRYGRYNSHGSIQVFKNTTSHTSGVKQAGWNWSKNPGTTSLLLPLDTLEGSKSFYGSGPKQNTSPSGAGSLNNKFGAFLFQLNPTSDDQSLKVRKSVFFIDDKLICLGSNITNQHNKFETITTLFQTSHIDQLRDSLAPSENQPWLVDNFETGYYLPEKVNDIQYSSGEQVSKHNKTRAKTQGEFSTAWINHGITPSNARYQYHMLLNASADKLEQWHKQQNSAQKIQIIQQDETAHAIHDPSNQITAYCLFAPFSNEDNTVLLNSTDRSCIVLFKKETPSSLLLSITDIDLPDLGKRNDKLESTVILNGKWLLDKPTKPSVQIIHENNTTRIRTPSNRGQSINLRLTLAP